MQEDIKDDFIVLFDQLHPVKYEKQSIFREH